MIRAFLAGLACVLPALAFSAPISVSRDTETASATQSMSSRAFQGEAKDCKR